MRRVPDGTAIEAGSADLAAFANDTLTK